MAEDGGTEGGGGYLPPEAPGKEPDLGPAKAPQQGPQPPTWQAQPQYAPPAATPGQGYPPQQAGWGAPPPGWQQPPPGWPPPPPGWQPPPPQPWAYQPPQPVVPDNGSAVAGFVLSLVAFALLVMSAGLSTIVSLTCGGLGIMYSVKGRRRVDRGETPRHRGLAQAGFVIGIVAVVLAALATAGWIVVIANGDLIDDNNGTNGDPRGFEAAVRVGASVLRAAGLLLR